MQPPVDEPPLATKEIVVERAGRLVPTIGNGYVILEAGAGAEGREFTIIGFDGTQHHIALPDGHSPSSTMAVVGPSHIAIAYQQFAGLPARDIPTVFVMEISRDTFEWTTDPAMTSRFNQGLTGLAAIGDEFALMTADYNTPVGKQTLELGHVGAWRQVNHPYPNRMYDSPTAMVGTGDSLAICGDLADGTIEVTEIDAQGAIMERHQVGDPQTITDGACVSGSDTLVFAQSGLLNEPIKVFGEFSDWQVTEVAVGESPDQVLQAGNVTFLLARKTDSSTHLYRFADGAWEMCTSAVNANANAKWVIKDFEGRPWLGEFERYEHVSLKPLSALIPCIPRG